MLALPTRSTVPSRDYLSTLIASLFANGEQGGWYDPSDMSTLFQDSAGTVPVTAVEQPVGRVLDKSGRGNHLHQPTAAARPVLSARVNHLDDTEYRTTTAVGPTTRVGAFGGYSGGCKFNGGAASYWYRPAPLGITAVFSSIVLMEDGLPPLLGPSAGQDFCPVVNGGPAQSGAVINSLGDGYYRITCVPLLITGSNTGIIKYAANSARKFTVTAYSLVEVGNTSLPYQRVNTASDYDTVGFLRYLKFDGVDDSLRTVGNMDLSGSDKVTLVAGVRKLSDAAFGNVVIHGILDGGPGLYLVAPASAGPNFGIRMRGSALAGLHVAVSYPAPISAVLSSQYDILNGRVDLRVNGAASQLVSSAGTGNFAADRLMFVGAGPGSTSPFNGHLGCLIIRGAASTPAQIAALESYVNDRTKAY